MLLTPLFIRSRANMRSPSSAQTGLAALAVITAACLLAACGGGSNGTNGNTALVKSSAEPAGANCAAGGTRVQSGLDLDSNAVLDAAEITGTSFICNGAAGAVGAGGSPGAAAVANLVRTTPEPAGANCATGGIRIQSGADTSGNGSLEPVEVTQTSYACNGATGTTGAAGTPGAVGGAGINSLIRTTPEAAGANCPAGGLKVESGLDTSGDGSLQNAEVTATSYICRLPSAVIKTWGEAALIEVGALNAVAPQVKFDTNGNAIAVWSQTDGTRLNIWANRYTKRDGWGTAGLIEIDNAGNAFKPQIAFDSNGNALAVWQQSDGTRNNIWANRYTFGSGWGTAALIETDNAGDALKPQIAIDARGNAIAVWQQFDGTRANIWANSYTFGSGWGTAALIETDNAGDAREAQIAIDANGNALAVWTQSDGTRFNISANRYTLGSGWGTAELIETDNAGGADSPQIAIDASSNAIAVWQQSDGTRNNIWANRYTLGSGWGTAALIETENAGRAADPQIAFDSNGNALAVWEQFDGARFSIWSNRYALGSGWGTAALIETDNVGNAYTAQIAIDANGNAIAVWYQADGIRFNIWANRYTLGSGWGTAALIETDNAGDAAEPQIAIDANGNAIVVWQQFDGTRNNIVFNDYR